MPRTTHLLDFIVLFISALICWEKSLSLKPLSLILSMPFPGVMLLSNSIMYFLARVDSFLAQEAPLPNLSSAYSPVNYETFTQRLIPFLSGEANLRKRSVFVILAIFNLRIFTYIALLFIITHICPKVDYMFKFLFD